MQKPLEPARPPEPVKPAAENEYGELGHSPPAAPALPHPKPLPNLSYIGLDLKEERFDINGQKAIGQKYTLTKNGVKCICPFKVQDWNVGLADQGGNEPYKPTCNSHCPHFKILGDMEDVDSKGVMMARIEILCGTKPVFYMVGLTVGLRKDEETPVRQMKPMA